MKIVEHVEPQDTPALPDEPAAWWVDVGRLRGWAENPRKHSSEQVAELVGIIKRFGWGPPVVARRGDGELIAGHGRMLAAGALGLAKVPVRWMDLDPGEAHLMAVADNRSAQRAQDDEEKLLEFLRAQSAADAALVGYGADDIESLVRSVGASAGNGAGGGPSDADVAAARTTLAERFLVPPFTVLDARQGYWRDRKRAWIALGLRSELGRGEVLDAIPPNERDLVDRAAATRAADARTFRQDLMRGEHVVGQPAAPRRPTSVAGARPVAELDETSRKIATTTATGTSIFDPVLCELIYRWFSAPDAVVLDPFAGGSVRGVVAGALGRRYVGFDLRAEQCEANREQWRTIAARRPPAAVTTWVDPTWTADDADNIDAHLAPEFQCDLVFTCPPYADLERYSDDPRDLSTMGHDAFLAAYRQIIAKAIARLRPDRFAAVVVGDVREPSGFYRRFVVDTIEAFENAAARLYNEAVLVTAVGSLPLRVPRQFDAGRKLGKTHQNVLVFVKGDWRKAVAACGPVDVSWTLPTDATEGDPDPAAPSPDGREDG